jgi:hypothetical protein
MYSELFISHQQITRRKHKEPQNQKCFYIILSVQSHWVQNWSDIREMKTMLDRIQYGFDMGILDLQNESKSTYSTICIWYGFLDSVNENEAQLIKLDLIMI